MVIALWNGRVVAAGAVRPLVAALGAAVLAPALALPVAAFGETRTLTLYHTHTQESATVTFRRNGEYDEDGLRQINWLLRDWRVQQPANMDPRLFDILWEVQQELGSREAIHVISAYRSPATNAMLRQASSGVSEHSQHMHGKAIDIRLPGVDAARLRAAAMRLQYGGVGFYPGSAFVHVDTGSVRAWPRMSQDQLARLFPDGKTAHLPASGKPLPGHEEARAQIAARNAVLAEQASRRGFGGSIVTALANLFGRREPAAPAPAAPTLPAQVAAYAPAVPAEGAQAPSAVPLPPRRPADLGSAVVLAAGAAAMPPMGRAAPAPDPSPADPGRNLTLAAGVVSLPSEGSTPASWPNGEAAAERLLFSAHLFETHPRQPPRITLARVQPRPLDGGNAILDMSHTSVALAFSSTPTGEAGSAHFSGPAVMPLAALRVAAAEP